MSGPRFTADEVFARARAVSCRDVAEQCGAEWRSARRADLWWRAKLCPLCGGRNDFCCTTTGFKCHKCTEKGDAIDLWFRFAACRSLLDAAAEIAGIRAEEIVFARREDRDQLTAHDEAAARRAAALQRADARRAKAALEPDDDEGAAIARALALWQRARPAGGTLVEVYLKHRGIPAWLAHIAARRMRFLPDAGWWDDEIEDNFRRPPDRVTPAMVCMVETAAGPTGGVHVTHLAHDGRGKADFGADSDGRKRAAKKMHGPQRRGGRPGGILLLPPSPDATLSVCEGIESTLSLAAMMHARDPKRPLGAFAARSLDGLQGGMGRGAWGGGADWRRPFPDPDAPAATLPHSGPVVIGVDHDMKPLEVDKGRRWAKTISPTRRAQVCGVLAAYWWGLPVSQGGAGASDVRVFQPREGADPNDELAARLAAAAIHLAPNRPETAGA